MRWEGTISRWNDERGFGFIAPAQGSGDIFFHISGFARRDIRPQIGQAVTFRVAAAADGRTEARRVEPIGLPWPISRHHAGRSILRGAGDLIVLLAFVIAYLAASVWWSIPLWVASWYAATSLAAFVSYAVDKQAAIAGRWRTSEATLLLLGLLGGWPGAIAAQHLFRHKTSKASFYVAFRVTVILNATAFLLAASPEARTAFVGAVTSTFQHFAQSHRAHSPEFGTDIGLQWNPYVNPNPAHE
jgi:uncharacterized membrane protein YsdA (DUF1294 family)/cold shock CspA family protein